MKRLIIVRIAIGSSQLKHNKLLLDIFDLTGNIYWLYYCFKYPALFNVYKSLSEETEHTPSSLERSWLWDSPILYNEYFVYVPM